MKPNDAQLTVSSKRFAYADAPYLGCAAKLYGDPTYDAPEAHQALIERMCAEYPDGWAMSCHTPSMRVLLPFCPEDVRVAAWVKPFCAFKVGVNPAYAWEPVIWRGGRKKRSRKDDTIRDYHSEPITLMRGMPGAKPPGFVAWIVQLLGADVRKGDTITDLFHGSGAMLGVWRMPAQTDWSQKSHKFAQKLIDGEPSAALEEITLTP